MASDWTPMRNDLRDDPAVVTISLALKMEPDTVVGKLLRVWAWAGSHTTTGAMPHTSLAHVDHAAGAQGFGDAMRLAGWLVVDEPDGVTFPRWKKRNGKAAKKRLLDAKRASRYRVTNVTQPSRKGVTKSAPTEQNKQSDKRATEQKINTALASADSSAAGIALAARQKAPEFDLVRILRRWWPRSDKAFELARHPNATPARVCWLADRAAREKPAKPPGFIEKGIIEGWKIPPEWVAKFEKATGQPSLKLAGAGT